MNEGAYRKLVMELDRVKGADVPRYTVILRYDFYSYLLSNYDFVFFTAYQPETIRGFVYEVDHFLEQEWEIRDGHQA